METLPSGFCQLGVVDHLMKEYKCRLLNHHASAHKSQDISDMEIHTCKSETDLSYKYCTLTGFSFLIPGLTSVATPAPIGSGNCRACHTTRCNNVIEK